MTRGRKTVGTKESSLDERNFNKRGNPFHNKESDEKKETEDFKLIDIELPLNDLNKRNPM